MHGTTGLLILTLLVGAAGQEPGPTVDRARADALRLDADALLVEVGMWREAAALLERAAGFRANADPRRAEELRMAAQIHWHFDDHAAAERLLIQSAEAAAARGAILEAAHAYLSAAELARLNGSADRAHDFTVRAANLAGSPHLSGPERRAITGSMGIEVGV